MKYPPLLHQWMVRVQSPVVHLLRITISLQLWSGSQVVSGPGDGGGLHLCLLEVLPSEGLELVQC